MTEPAPSGLSPEELHLLEVEQSHARGLVLRYEEMVVLGMDPADYFAKLNRIIDLDAALAWNPPMVRRLRRQRTTRVHQGYQTRHPSAG